jgi:DNA gyrase subunit B
MALKKTKKTDTASAVKAGGTTYSAKDISVLEGLEPVRKRPGMYIGTTGPEGLHHLIWEVFDNSRDEAMGGYADRVEVTLLPNNRVRVADNGRGIPVDIHKQTKTSALETIMTTLHAGGKFGGEGYKVSGGLHGVGVSVVNALSIYARAEVHREGSVYMQEYSQGKKKAPVKKISTTKETGTVITFEPDGEIFKELGFSWNKIVSHLRQQAYLVKGLEINVLDLRKNESLTDKELTHSLYLRELGKDAPSMSYYFEGGLLSLVKFYNESQKSVHKNIFYVEKEADGVGVEISFQYVDDISARIMAFGNNTYNSEGGMHVTGFKTALTRTLNSYARTNSILKEKDENFAGDDVLEGLTAVISVKLPEIQFEGQTKAKLGSPEARGAVESVFGEALQEFFEENPVDAKSIISKVLLALKARKAAKAAKESVLRKGALEGLSLPGKLADCSVRSPEKAELFIVEGDSAGGSSKQGRDRRTQAVLPLRGKILNVERARLDRILSSNEVKSLVIALGTAIGDSFNLEKLRYHKIVIATDADVDGAHIRTLLLTLFYRYFKPLIEGGYIYIAQPPLYKVQQGKEINYFYTEGEKDAFFKKSGISFDDTDESVNDSDADGDTDTDTEKEEGEEDADTTKTKRKVKVSIQRYKGLGEMNADELWETTMDPENRVLKQVNIEDAAEADKIFDTLMGTDVPARKSFIRSNAKMANLDI